MDKRVLVSACLLGVPCRYDGLSKADPVVREAAARYGFIPVCPEILGGLATPRTPAERVGERVLTKDGRDVTEAYAQGARAVCALAKLYSAAYACLKERSPSCGCGAIYDGTFSGTLTRGNGTTTDALRAMGVHVYGESALETLMKDLAL